MAREALNLMGEETTPERATSLAQSATQRCGVDVEGFDSAGPNEPLTGRGWPVHSNGRGLRNGTEVPRKATNMGAPPAVAPEETLLLYRSRTCGCPRSWSRGHPFPNQRLKSLFQNLFKPCPS